MAKKDSVKEILLTTLEFQGYVRASLEAIKLDVIEIKHNFSNYTGICDKRIDEIEKDQSKLKGIYMGVAGILGAIGGFFAGWFK